MDTKRLDGVSIVGITGHARAGKDTLADVLVEEFGYTKARFADPLKDGLAVILGITRDKLDILKEAGDKTISYGLQTLGTEWGRNIMGEDFWVNALENSLCLLREMGVGRIVIPDIRFDNEAALVHRLGGVLVSAIRPDAAPILGANHESERPISPGYFDWCLENTGDIRQWQAAARSLGITLHN